MVHENFADACAGLRIGDFKAGLRIRPKFATPIGNLLRLEYAEKQSVELLGAKVELINAF